MLETLEYPKVLTMQQSFGADNQQITDARISWLAGIIDAEGSIGLYKNGNGNYYARITITNTCVEMLDTIKAILDDYGLRGYIQEGERQKAGKGKWKPRWQMVFSGSTKPQKLLGLVLPHLITKRNEAILTLEFIEGRSSKRYQNREGSRWSKDPLTKREEYLIQEVKNLKQTRHLRDYMQSA